jgi:hypothetical protein
MPTERWLEIRQELLELLVFNLGERLIARDNPPCQSTVIFIDIELL